MSTSRRIIGGIMVFFAVVSLLITIYGIFMIWQLREPVQAGISDGLDLVSATLQATATGLNVANQTIETVRLSVESLETTTQTLAKSIGDTAPLISALGDLTGQVLPKAVTSAQSSLDSAQKGAEIVDTVLRALTIFNRNAYNPAVPLHVALGDVSSSLDELPDSLYSMEDSLNSTQENMDSVQNEIKQIAGNIGEISDSLKEGQEVLGQYQELVTQTLKNIDLWQENLPNVINALAWVFTFIFIWLGIAQFGLLMQGWGMFRPRETEETNEV